MKVFFLEKGNFINSIDASWEFIFFYKNIITLIIIFHLILILGLILPKNATSIKYLNLTSGFFLLLSVILTSWDIFTIKTIYYCFDIDLTKFKQLLNNFFEQSFFHVDTGLYTELLKNNLYYCGQCIPESIKSNEKPIEALWKTYWAIDKNFIDWTVVDKFKTDYQNVITKHGATLDILNTHFNELPQYASKNYAEHYQNYITLKKNRIIDTIQVINCINDLKGLNFLNPTRFLITTNNNIEFSYVNGKELLPYMLIFWIDTLFYTTLNYGDDAQSCIYLKDISNIYTYSQLEFNTLFDYLKVYRNEFENIPSNILDAQIKASSPIVKKYPNLAWIEYARNYNIFYSAVAVSELVHSYILYLFKFSPASTVSEMKTDAVPDIYQSWDFIEINSHNTVTAFNRLLAYYYYISNLFECVDLGLFKYLFSGHMSPKTFERYELIFYNSFDNSCIINEYTKLFTIMDSFKLNSFYYFPQILNNALQYVNLFEFISILTVALFFFGISSRFFLYQNKSMEYNLLVLLILISSILAINSIDLIEIVLSLECIGLCSYVLVGFERKNKFSAFSGIRYLIMSTIASALLILGCSLLYKEYGSLFRTHLELLLYSVKLEDLNTLNDMSKISEDSDWIITKNNIFNFLDFENFKLQYNYISLSITIGLIFILVNFLFKITSAPFHVWAPTIYGNAPLPTTTFLSIFSKLTIIFLLIDFLSTTFRMLNEIWEPILISCSILTIICGILGAISERLVKRFFVYSSMSHIGFILVGISLANLQSLTASINYLVIYIMSSFIIWFTIMLLLRQLTHLTNFKILKNNNDIICFIFSLTMFSMSGIPPLGGFFVKFEILNCLINSSLYYIAFILLLLTVISFFYYLRIIKIIYFENSQEFMKLKYLEENKLRIITLLWHFIAFFVIYFQTPIIYLISSTIETLF